jgi:hypothetical protein
MMKNTNLLIAAAAGLLQSPTSAYDIARASAPMQRTFKIRPENYTQPMIVSSDKEIAEWNPAVDAKKIAHRNARFFARRTPNVTL